MLLTLNIYDMRKESTVSPGQNTNLSPSNITGELRCTKRFWRRTGLQITPQIQHDVWIHLMHTKNTVADTNFLRGVQQLRACLAVRNLVPTFVSPAHGTKGKSSIMDGGDVFENPRHDQTVERPCFLHGAGAVCKKLQCVLNK